MTLTQGTTKNAKSSKVVIAHFSVASFYHNLVIRALSSFLEVGNETTLGTKLLISVDNSVDIFCRSPS